MAQVTITRLGHQGDGIAGDIRAPFTLPGEEIRGAVGAGVIADPEILAASPDRAAPPCRHFGTCGGCALQHASDAFLAEWKRSVTRRALAARGIAAPMPPALTAPPRSRRRATFTGRRTRKTVVVGFHGRRSETLVDVTECWVVRPEILASRPALEAITRLGASRAHALRMTVACGDAGLDLSVTGGKPLDAALRLALAGVVERHDLARLAWEGETLAQRRPPAHSFGRARVAPPPGAFLQATAEGEAALLAQVRDALGPARRLADLFAGCGAFALPLAERAEVHAVEGEAAMLMALDAGWRAAPGLRRVTTEARDLFRRPLTPAELDGFEAVVIDPPFAGAEAQMRALAASRVSRVAAVSCNPVSFARDAAILTAAGFALEEVQVVDQFRWSAHVELAARFVRGAKPQAARLP